MTGRRSERVVGRDEVDRPAHEHDPDRVPLLHRLRQRGRVEAGEAGVERDVGRGGELGLEPDEVLGGGERVHRDRLEEELAGEQRPVERALREDGLGHRPSLPSGFAPPTARRTVG